MTVYTQLVRAFVVSASLLALLGSPRGVAAQGEAIDLFEGAAPSSTGLRIETSSGTQHHVEPHAGAGGGFTLAFEERGSSILVPATVEGRAVYFVFDTGATYTTLTSKFAKSAGLTPGKDAPVGRFRTANGTMSAPWGVINSLRFGGRGHGNVTFGVCDNCPSGTYRGKEVVGLLGLNVIGRYRTSFDHSRGLIEMAPTADYANRWRDVDPFVEVKFNRPTLSPKTKGFVITGTVTNRAPKTVREMTFECSCGETRGRDKVKIAPGGTAKFSIVLASPTCEQFDQQIVDARW